MVQLIQNTSSNACTEGKSTVTVSSLQEKLTIWANKHHISQVAIRDLICVLNEVSRLSNLPSDPRALMKTPRTMTDLVIKSNNGDIAHLGSEKGLIVSLNKYHNIYPKLVKVNINIDGLSVNKSSSSQFSPILGSTVEDFYTEPFVISVIIMV